MGPQEGREQVGQEGAGGCHRPQPAVGGLSEGNWGGRGTDAEAFQVQTLASQP